MKKEKKRIKIEERKRNAVVVILMSQETKYKATKNKGNHQIKINAPNNNELIMADADSYSDLCTNDKYKKIYHHFVLVRSTLCLI